MSRATSRSERLRLVRRHRSLAPCSGVKTNVVSVCFIETSVLVCNQYRLQAACPVFKRIRPYLLDLAPESTSETPTQGTV